MRNTSHHKTVKEMIGNRKQLLLFKKCLGVGLVLLLIASAIELKAQTWVGGTVGFENSWNTASNWNPVGVPNSGDDIIIPDVVNDPILTVAATGLKSVTIQTGGSLTINSGGDLTVTTNDFIINSGGFLTMNSGGSVSTVKSLKVDGTLTFNNGTATCKDFEGSGTTNMSGGTLKVSSDFKPTTPGNFNPTGGTVEFTGSGSGTAFPSGTYQFFNVQINSSVNPKFDRAGNTYNIKGTLTNNGSATFAGTTVNFNGDIAQSIAGSSATPFGTLNITNTSATVTASQNFSVATAASVNSGATLDMGTSVMSGGGAFELKIGGTLGIGSPEGITANACGTGSTCGNIRTTTRTFAPNANYTYNASGPQVMGTGLPSSVGNLTLSGSGTKTDSDGRTIIGDLSIGSGVTYSVASGKSLDLKGDFTNDGTATLTGTTVSFSGTNPQTIGGSAFTTFSTLNITNTVATVTASQNMTVTTAATVSGGANLDIGTNTISGTGDFTLSGTLQLTMASLMNFGKVDLQGAATLTGGTIVANFGSYVPAMNDMFSIFSLASSFTGTPTVNTTSDTHVIMVTYNGNGTFTVGTVVLPIELLSFQARVMDHFVGLSWRTATEQNNDYMAVERSADGAKFTELGRIKGAGTTEEPQAYSFIDENPLRGLNYYRLRQVDFDGAFEYHKTISVVFDGKRQGLGVQAFPNPVQGQLQAAWVAASDQPTTLQVLDMTGRKLAEYQAAAGVSTFDLPLDGLPAGLYFLKARQGQEEEAMRFWKQ